MLTTYQASPGAYGNEHGELLCLDCAAARFPDAETTDQHGLFLHLYNVLDPEETGFQAVIGYTLDEIQTENAQNLDEFDRPEGCTEECEPALIADLCGHELREAWHYGHDVGEQNPVVSRWVPCPQCRAGDGERHREGCPRIGGYEA